MNKGPAVSGQRCIRRLVLKICEQCTNYCVTPLQCCAIIPMKLFLNKAYAGIQLPERIIMGLLDDLKGKVDSVLDKTDLDEKILAKAGELKEKAKEALDKTDIDEKIAAKAGELKEKAKEALNKTDIDDKILAKAGELKDKAAAALGAAQGKAEAAAEEAAQTVEEAAQTVEAAADAVEEKIEG